MLIAYDGTGYHGWQRQPNGPTIQAEIEHAVSVICDSRTTVYGAGRTDAGVHALGMCAHFETTSRISCERLANGLNGLLPDQIRIVDTRDQQKNFHARFSASHKTYRYSIFTGAIQCPLQRRFVAHFPGAASSRILNSCLEIVTGTHDFSSFETSGTRDKTITSGKGATRTIYKTRLEQVGQESFEIFFTGDGFLRHMVRNLAGTIIEVAQGKHRLDTFAEILEMKDRQCAGATAPARGLTLMSIHYNIPAPVHSSPPP